MNYEDFKKAYVEALLWSETDYDDDGGRDKNFQGCGSQLDDNALACIDSDCGNFWQQMQSLKIAPNLAEQAGHDFALTRNHHGAGFWDRPEVYGKENAERLTTRAEAFSTTYLVRLNQHTITLEG